MCSLIGRGTNVNGPGADLRKGKVARNFNEIAGDIFGKNNDDSEPRL